MPLLHQGLLLARQARNGAAAPVLPQQSLDFSSYPTTGLQQFGFFIIIFFPVVSVFLVGLRIYGRATTKTFGSMTTLSLRLQYVVTFPYLGILAAAEAVFSYAMMKLQYIGVHAWQLPTTPYDPKIGMIVNYIVVMLYNPELGLVKSSVLFFLLRLGSGGHQPVLRRLIHILNWANMGLLVAVLFASIFTCVPVHKYWDRDIPVLTDVLVVAISIKIVVGLQIARKLKAILIWVLCSGIIVTIFSILRMRSIYLLYYPPADPGPDPTHDISFVYSTIECNLAIITATIPPLHGLMRRWFPRFFQSTSGRSSGYQNGYIGGSRTLQTIGGSLMALKDLSKGPMRSHRARLNSSLSNSEEDILAKDRITRTTSVHITFERGSQSRAGEQPPSYNAKS